jgi:hypothetical protein
MTPRQRLTQNGSLGSGGARGGILSGVQRSVNPSATAKNGHFLEKNASGNRQRSVNHGGSRMEDRGCDVSALVAGSCKDLLAGLSLKAYCESASVWIWRANLQPHSTPVSEPVHSARVGMPGRISAWSLVARAADLNIGSPAMTIKSRSTTYILLETEPLARQLVSRFPKMFTLPS